MKVSIPPSVSGGSVVKMKTSVRNCCIPHPSSNSYCARPSFGGLLHSIRRGQQLPGKTIVSVQPAKLIASSFEPRCNKRSIRRVVHLTDEVRPRVREQFLRPLQDVGLGSLYVNLDSVRHDVFSREIVQRGARDLDRRMRMFGVGAHVGISVSPRRVGWL